MKPDHRGRAERATRHGTCDVGAEEDSPMSEQKPQPVEQVEKREDEAERHLKEADRLLKDRPTEPPETHRPD
jgi:hypothetical protein